MREHRERHCLPSNIARRNPSLCSLIRLVKRTETIWMEAQRYIIMYVSRRRQPVGSAQIGKQKGTMEKVARRHFRDAALSRGSRSETNLNNAICVYEIEMSFYNA